MASIFLTQTNAEHFKRQLRSGMKIKVYNVVDSTYPEQAKCSSQFHYYRPSWSAEKSDLLTYIKEVTGIRNPDAHVEIETINEAELWN